MRLPVASATAGTLGRIGASARPVFVRTVAAIASIKVILGCAILSTALIVGDGAPPLRQGLLFATAAVFTTTGVALVLGGARDRRATVLGTSFLLVASVFADQIVTIYHARASLALTVARGISALQVDAFIPYLLWLFVREFPRVSQLGAGRRRLRIASNIAFTVGMLLFAANVVAFIVSLHPRWPAFEGLLDRLSRHNNHGPYWPIQFGLSIAALPVLVWRGRRARFDEQRRAALLVWGLIAGTLPTIVWVLFIAPYAPARALLPLRIAGWVIYPTLLSTPVMTAYAVLARRALDVRLVVRRAAQYALARYSVTALAAVPIVLLVISIYGQRDGTGTVATSRNAILFLVFSGVGLLALQRRRTLLQTIDRRFFREQYDARLILGGLVDRCRTATDRHSLADLLRTEIDRALHLDTTHVLFLDQETQCFTSPSGDVRPLAAGSRLAELVRTSNGPLDADVESSNLAVRMLSDADRHWLVDGGVRLLLPLRGAGHKVMGLVALGEKRSELPYSKEDAELLAAVASAAEMTIAYHGLEPRPDEMRDAATSPAEPFAFECEECGVVLPRRIIFCNRCAAVTRECLLPEIVGGKLRVEQRIGAGGMGVVYRGTDIDLDRPVAIKTLPLAFPEEAARLRREAKAMALVSHANLALIFGLETWRGRPMLVCEYLAGGTLTARIKSGPMSLIEALSISIDLASALDAIHRAGLLHLDIKPSNIGFGTDGTPKLLDFGIARMFLARTLGLDERRPARTRDGDSSPRLSEASANAVGESMVFGTVLYMSPEALVGAQPEATFDLWSLSVVLYEMVAGCLPFQERAILAARARQTEIEFPDIRDHSPAAPAELAVLFHDAFSHDPNARPSSAAELGDRLRRIRSTLGPVKQPPHTFIGRELTRDRDGSNLSNPA